jgi:hypothetical protein
MKSKQSVGNLNRKAEKAITISGGVNKAGRLHNSGLVYAWSCAGLTVQKMVTCSQTTTSKLRIGCIV